MKITAILFSLLIFFLLLFLPLSIQAVVNQDKKSTSNKEPISNGYLVELKNKPLSQYKKDLVNSKQDKTQILAITNDYQKTLTQEHETVKKDIAKLLGKDEKSINSSILKEYSQVLNGLTINISKEEAEKIKTLSLINKVSPNYQAKIALMDSVPLIKADQVWKLDDQNGKKITGEGVTVGIIDTGIDTTHPDLGSSTIAERSFEKINDQPILPKNMGSTMVIDKDNIAYLSQQNLPNSANKIYLYSFSTKNRTEISPEPVGSHAVRLALKDNLLVYVSDKYSDTNPLTIPSIYYVNLTTMVHTKIAESITHGTIAITNNKIIYAREITPGSANGITGLFVFDTQTNTETQIAQLRETVYMPVAWGNLVGYVVPDSIDHICYSKIVLYDLETGQSRDIIPPDVGPLLDIREDNLLYTPCSKTNFDPSWRKYYVYNLSTGQYQQLEYPNQTVISGEKAQTNMWAFSDWIFRGYLEDKLVYFSKNINTNKIIIYDQNLKRYVQLNIVKPALDFNADGNRACFISFDFNIYCHTYNPSDSYSMPSNIYNAKVVDGYNFVENNNNSFDDYGHGTHVAAITAGNGSLKGAAPQAKLVSYKVMNSSGSGWFSDIIAAIERAAQTKLDQDPANDVDIINLSLGMDCKSYFGGYTADCGPDDLQSKAVDNAVDTGVIVVIAAGNSGEAGSSTIGSPGTARKAITVGAVDKSKQIASFSSKGPVIWNGETINKPDIVAPGVNICAAQFDKWLGSYGCLDQRHIVISGTSMAAPHIAGVAALIKQSSMNTLPEAIKNMIKNSAANLSLDVNIQGTGLVDALASLTLPSPSPTTACKLNTENPCKISTLCKIMSKECYNKSWSVTQANTCLNANTSNTSTPLGQCIVNGADWSYCSSKIEPFCQKDADCGVYQYCASQCADVAGKPIGTCVYKPTPFGNAVQYNKDFQAIAPWGWSNIQPQTFTVEAWVKWEGGPDRDQYIVRKIQTSRPGSSDSFAIFLARPGGLVARLLTTKGALLIKTEDFLKDQKWHHLALVNDSKNIIKTFRFYVDGKLKGGQPYFASINYGNGTLCFGSYCDSGIGLGNLSVNGGGNGDYSFYGQIDEVRISNKVRYNTNFTPPGKPFTNDSNTLGLWHMDKKNCDTYQNCTTPDDSSKNIPGQVLGGIQFIPSTIVPPSSSPSPSPTPPTNNIPVITTNSLPDGKILKIYETSVSGYDLDLNNNLTMKVNNLPLGVFLRGCETKLISNQKQITCKVNGIVLPYFPRKDKTFQVQIILEDNSKSNNNKVEKVIPLTIRAR